MSAFLDDLAGARLPQSRAVLAAGGLSLGRLRGPRWRRSSPGCYVPVAAGRDARGAMTPTQRILDAVPMIPDEGAIAGWAAAYVHGVDWLDGVGRDGLPGTVTVVRGSVADQRPDLPYGYRGELQPDEWEMVHGIPVTTLARTAFDCTRWRSNLTDAVVDLDAILHFTQLTAADVRLWLPRFKGWRGIRRTRQALALANPRVLSPWESRLRMLMTLSGSWPELLVNIGVRDRRSHRLVGFADLLDAEAGLVIEYDGSGHREGLRHQHDNVREEALEDLRLTVSRVGALDFRDPYGLLARLRVARARGLARDRSLDLWYLDAEAAVTAA